MVKLKEVGVWIVINGEEVEEFGTEVQNSTASVTSFISSISGQSFEIKVKNNLIDEVAFMIYLDGQALQGQLSNSGGTDTMQGASISSTSYRPFTFGDIQLTDDDALRKQPGWGDMGCIEVKVRRVVPGTRVPCEVADISSNVKNGLVHERSKKAGAHRVALGDSVVSRPAIANYQVKLQDTIAKPFAIFKFVYRPKELLQAQGIIPPPPVNKGKRRNDQPHEATRSPAERAREAIEREDGGEDDDDDEVAKTQNEIRALEAKAARLKAKLEAKGIKREASPVRVPASSKNDVIDLTDD